MRRRIHDWRLHLKSDVTLEDLARMVNPVVRGGVQYYGRFHQSALSGVLHPLNRALGQ